MSGNDPAFAPPPFSRTRRAPPVAIVLCSVCVHLGLAASTALSSEPQVLLVLDGDCLFEANGCLKCVSMNEGSSSVSVDGQRIPVPRSERLIGMVLGKMSEVDQASRLTRYYQLLRLVRLRARHCRSVGYVQCRLSRMLFNDGDIDDRLRHSVVRRCHHPEVVQRLAAEIASWRGDNSHVSERDEVLQKIGLLHRMLLDSHRLPVCASDQLRRSVRPAGVMESGKPCKDAVSSSVEALLRSVGATGAERDVGHADAICRSLRECMDAEFRSGRISIDSLVEISECCYDIQARSMTGNTDGVNAVMSSRYEFYAKLVEEEEASAEVSMVQYFAETRLSLAHLAKAIAVHEKLSCAKIGK